jgi:hypothetical protein
MGKIDGNVPAAKLPKKAKDRTFNHYLEVCFFYIHFMDYGNGYLHLDPAQFVQQAPP